MDIEGSPVGKLDNDAENQTIRDLLQEVPW